ncbi:8-amino-7-oxononanoate synthase [Arthrobacter sp. SORGH_AS 212]|uniref:aminotransferase class I/II-fold pyridoxal phosphate-dependent enzyme n=1 Tax=Pseudarthrobacter sp. SORGH_AS 212 TaxID=3041777 RepID=UPI00278A323D|nr:8-amino-7-oxononanoate synthase [Arthrobacter sp. SORGH_AS_0212]
MAGSHRPADFTSALFLGQHHPSASLAPWREFTTGVPAALRALPAAAELASAVAKSQDASAALVSRSALHGMMDVLQSLPRPGDLLLVDEGAYPLTRWACRASVPRGVRVVTYPHFQPPAVIPPSRAAHSARTWLVTDGWCQGCGQPAPLARLKELAACTGGQVIVDDSLAFGVLGRRPEPGSFGDGSGTLRWQGLEHDGVVWLGSLAKAYGTPVAVITGDSPTITRLARHGENRMHSSPPSAADLAAGLSALRDLRVPRLRTRLWRLTRWLRQAFQGLGLPLVGLPFPIVGTHMGSARLARQWWSALSTRGVETLVQLPRCRPGALLSAVVRADHSQVDLDRLVRALEAVSRDRRAA